jgi:hypothetical protein
VEVGTGKIGIGIGIGCVGEWLGWWSRVLSVTFVVEWLGWIGGLVSRCLLGFCAGIAGLGCLLELLDFGVSRWLSEWLLFEATYVCKRWDG